MKKFVVLVAVALLAVGTVRADTACIKRVAGPHFGVPALGDEALIDPSAGSVRRVRGVFRVFGDDEAVGASPRSSSPRRKSRRSSKARRSTETQKPRTNKSATSPDGILMLLDGLPPSL